MQCPDCLGEKKVYCHRCDGLGRIETISNELLELLMSIEIPDICDGGGFPRCQKEEQPEYDLVKD